LRDAVNRHWNRRSILWTATVPLLTTRVLAADNARLSYRGFSVDMSIAADVGNYSEVKSSIKHQLDIVADCGAKQEIIDFFRSTNIALVRSIKGGTPGQFTASHGVDVVAGILPSQQPIILHELLHAYNFYKLPDGWNNHDVQLFYGRAKGLYPSAEIHDGRRTPTYLLSNAREFFAVTASVYLWGYVDREPHTRERLRALQPIYYTWLGQQFGVQK
jgi:hypothetical protein